MKKINKLVLAFLFLLAGNTFYGQNLKIMTYNIRLDVASDGENAWPKRKDYFNSQIQFYSPDIFGVQEATPNQVTDIASALPNYNRFGIGREEGGLGEASCIYYKKDRFKVEKSNTFWLSETPDVVSRGWDAACNRVCTYGLFKDLKTKKTFWVFNLHLDHMGEVARVKGVELVLSKIEALNTKKYPVFLMGDFNSEPETKQIAEIKKVMNDTKDVSKEKPFGPSGTFNDFKHNEPVTLLLDYIFVSKNSGLTIQKHAVLSDSKDLKYPSDHLPVLIEID
ncbi:endonuclease/exonuclease/phosphatase family metal-dependent hydrolase [Flavobacterium nitrogenifigens]|uniref:Endonuclease/exonuclease/phosphatase family metal-dependent hydrolase n=2 Tax=Flavobacterium TaxID=237 RepID=A0A7W7IU80_9FLAO|nr:MULTISPECIES: endonuclease/exonuclease/phosphatase family protein [Flavobacterium]MBB4800292.1 endonuclease/exonuclease/phosphatase family metal-dependent hydrolase [Flavobacterium nitrogenifigens]MBB6385958.1 endonuclease/exonuclease/phosphatase family metal-dependent hydrolase [Flavobacterium notoginsengisoli]